MYDNDGAVAKNQNGIAVGVFIRVAVKSVVRVSTLPITPEFSFNSGLRMVNGVKKISGDTETDLYGNKLVFLTFVFFFANF